MSSTSIFDNYPNPATPGSVVPGNMPSRPNEYTFKRDWYLDQVYDPDIHDVTDIWTKYVVPYEGELVKDTKTKKLYIVTYVDTSTYKSTLAPFEYISSDGEDSDYPLFPKHHYGMLQGELPLFVDYSVSPPVASVSNLAYCANPSYALLYLGSSFTEEQTPISIVYDNHDSDRDKIPVKTVMPAGFNVEQDILKCTDVFSVTLPEETLKNGTRCTLVYYDENKNPIAPTYSLMVQHSQYLRDRRLARRFITGIELVAPWFTNSTDPTTLYIPVNLTLSSIEFRALLHYTDTTETYPVNGSDTTSGFVLYGTNRYKPTSPNQKGTLVLTYAFKDGEEAYIAQAGSPSQISQTYSIVSVPTDGAYSPRLYTYPYWDTKSGYKLKHYLSDLTRQFITDVTEHVRLNRLSPGFSGTMYGVEQKLTFNLTLSDVNAAYSNWTYTQDVDITLYNEGTSTYRHFGTRSSSDEEVFDNTWIVYVPKTGGVSKARFIDNYKSVTELLDALYYPMNPPIDPQREEAAYVPTHMTFYRENGSYKTMPVSAYSNLAINDWELVDNETFFIAWVYRSGAGQELQLGMTAVPVKKVSNY